MDMMAIIGHMLHFSVESMEKMTFSTISGYYKRAMEIAKAQSGK